MRMLRELVKKMNKLILAETGDMPDDMEAESMAVMVKAIQELKAEKDALEARVAALETS